MNPTPQSLYESAPRIHPRAVWGRFAQWRVVAMLALLGLFYVVPWIRVGGEHIVLFDLAARRFHVFGLTLVPQDLFLLTWLLILAAMTLFLFTTLAGRLWCGYACPQTVWTEAFLWIEHHIEGDRHKRMKLDRAPWTLQKILQRGGKHLAWMLFALFTGISFVGYFVPVEQVAANLVTLELGGWPLFWTLFYAFATWGNAGFMREQVCKYMCPYARFQSAMFDKDTLIIAYDEQRGEPRKSKARKLSDVLGGDCVDDQMCVQVCPTGIDIRDGLQYECIACAACIDACNHVMDAVGKPRNLIRYTTVNHDAGGRYRLLRGRSIGYGVIWAGLLLGFVALVLLRSSVELDVIRDRKNLYRVIDTQHVENVYTLKVTNKHDNPVRYGINVTGEQSLATISPAAIELAPGETRGLVVGVRAPLLGYRVETMTIELQDATGEVVADRSTNFFRPKP
ncbi:MAG: cytochrome c oxidase accessory protein CcoG [Abyssibacter sp.]|uniref:cytochrome c oxidase accessory protein CcoG n=1 Tax=Abyssibacter sp. TaxID=2320200 RepID=UPI0032192E2E